MTWMVAVADWKGEQPALESLAVLGLSCYCPMYRQRSVVRGRVMWSDRWLLGRYFFVGFTEAWRAVFTARGIAGVLKARSALTPGLVADEVVAELRAREVGGYVPVYSPRFFKGQKVRVTDGPFEGTDGLFDSFKDEDSSFVFLNVFGRASRTSVSSEMLASVGWSAAA